MTTPSVNPFCAIRRFRRGGKSLRFRLAIRSHEYPQVAQDRQYPVDSSKGGPLGLACLRCIRLLIPAM